MENITEKVTGKDVHEYMNDHRKFGYWLGYR